MFSYGLDFGTYRSIMAEKRPGSPMPVKAEYTTVNRNGIPSLFWTNGIDRYCCDEVINRNYMEIDPSGVCSSIKMHLDEEEIVLNGRNYHPREIMQHVVNQIYKVSSNNSAFAGSLNKCSRIVVGVPLLFGSKLRSIYKNAIKDGINIFSGRDVENIIDDNGIILVPESTLAALAVKRAIETDKNSKSVKANIVVCDFGAGTFDCDFLTTNNDTSKYPYPYISHNASGCLEAGNKFDEMMVDLIMRKLAENPSFPLATFKNKEHHDYLTLREQARDAKEYLSKNTSHRMIVRLAADRSVSANVRIERDEYEKEIRPIVINAIKVVRRTIEYTISEMCPNGDCSDFDFDVFLVGGSSVIPLIKKCMQDMLDQLCQKRGYLKPNVYLKYPSEAVAFGAAIYAESPNIIEPRIAFSYGLKSFYQIDNCNAIQVIIPSNMGVKSKISESFCYETRYEGQEKMVFPIYEIGNDVVDSQKKGAIIPLRRVKTYISNKQSKNIMEYKFERSVPKGTPVKLILELDDNGTLTAKAGVLIQTAFGYVFDENSVQIRKFDCSQ